ncbi:hypothetical protein ABPG72_018910 [Tetrahymena utriculariae]
MQQVTYLKPESVNKLHQSFLKLPYSELSANQKCKRSKSLVNNLMMEKIVGETIQDDIYDKIIINNQASKRNTIFMQNNYLVQLKGKRDTISSQDFVKNKSQILQNQNSQIHKHQRLSQITKNKRSQSVNATPNKSIEKISYMTQSQLDVIIQKNQKDNLEYDIIEQKLLQNPAKQGNILEIQRVYKEQNKIINQENKQKSLKEIQDSDSSLNNSFVLDEPVSKKQKMEEIREHYYCNLKDLLKIADKDFLILKSKQLFESSFAIMKKTVEDYDQIIKELRGRIFRLNNENTELETTNEWLKRLNHQLDKQKREISDNQQLLMNQLSDLKSFKDNYILMQTKFSNINLEKFINNYEILDKKAFEYLTKLSILEDKKYQLARCYKEAKETIQILEKENEQLKLSKDGLNQFSSSRNTFEIDNNRQLMSSNQNLTVPFYQQNGQELNKQKNSSNEEQHYKKQYNQIFNRILSMYNKILDKQSILYFDEQIVRCNLDDPLDILNSIEKMIQFNAFQNYQNEMKNMITASNKLIKACYDESSAEIFNEKGRFDCEAIYNKIVAIYKAYVNNQIRQSIQYELKAADLVKREACTNSELITNSDIIKGNVVTIQASFIKAKGKIINSNKEKITNFFGYKFEEEEKRIQNLSDIIPSFINKIHPQLMNNLIVKGYSPYINQNLHTYSISKQGFIFPINLKFDYINTIKDDFVLNGCIQKYDNLNEYILLDSQGFIQGITEQIYYQIFDHAKNMKNHTPKQQNHTIPKMNLEQIVDKTNIFYIMPSLFQYIQIKSTNQITTFQSLKSIDEFSKKNLNYENQLHNQKSVITLPSNLSKISSQLLVYRKNSQRQSLLEREDKQLNQSQINDQSEEQYFFLQFQQYYEKNRHVKKYKEIFILLFKKFKLFLKLKFWSDQNCLNKLLIQFNLIEKQFTYFANELDQVSQKYYILEISEVSQLDIQIPRPEEQSTQSNSFTHNSQAIQNEIISLKMRNRVESLMQNPSQLQIPIFTNNYSTPLLCFTRGQEDSDTFRGGYETFRINDMERSYSKRLMKPVVVNTVEQHNQRNFTNTILGGIQQINFNQDKSLVSEHKNEILFELENHQSSVKKADIEERQGINSFLSNGFKNTESYQENQIQQYEGSNISQSELQIQIINSLQSPTNRDKYFALNNLISPKSPNLVLLPTYALKAEGEDANKIITQQEIDIQNQKNRRYSLSQIEIPESPIKYVKNQSSLLNMSGIILIEQNRVRKQRNRSTKRQKITFNMTESSKSNKQQEMSQIWKRVNLNKQATIGGINEILKHQFSEVSKEERTQGSNQRVSDLINSESKNQQEDNNQNKCIIKNQQPSITTLSSFTKGAENDVIQQIAFKKNPRIINLLNLILIGRFAIILFLLLSASIILIIDAQKLIDNFGLIQKFKSSYQLYVQEFLTGLNLFSLYDGSVYDSEITQKYQSSLEQQIQRFGEDFSEMANQNSILFSLYFSNSHLKPITAVIYSGQQFNFQTTVQPLEFLMKTFNALLSLAFSSDRQNIEGFFYLIANSLSSLQAFQSLEESFSDSFYDTYSNLSQRYAICGLIVGSSLICIFIITQFFLCQLARYQEKIIFLVTKLDLNDIQYEISKLSNCYTALNKKNNQWISTSFSNILYQFNYQKNIEHFSYSNKISEKNTTDDKRQSKKQKQNQQLQNQGKNKSNLQFSSTIQGQSISTVKFQLMLTIVLVLCLILFTVILTLSYNKSLKMNPSITLQKKTTQLIYATNTALLFTDLLSVKAMTQNKYFPQIQNSQYLSVSLQSVNIIRNYINQFVTYTESIGSYDQNFQSNLNDYFSSDLCKIYDSNQFCTDAENIDYQIRKPYVSSGLSGLLSRYNQYFGNIINTISSQNTSQAKSELSSYMNSQDNEILILQGFQLPLLSLEDFLELINQNIIDTATSLKNTEIIYFMIFCSIFLVILLMIDRRVRKQIIEQVYKLNFSLTFIPIHKQHEKVMIQMLKQINKS